MSLCFCEELDTLPSEQSCVGVPCMLIPIGKSIRNKGPLTLIVNVNGRSPKTMLGSFFFSFYSKYFYRIKYMKKKRYACDMS